LQSDRRHSDIAVMRRLTGAASVPMALAACWLLGAAREAAAVASPWATNPQSQVRLITSDLVAPRHGELRLGIHYRLAPGWHVYWKNSGDAGFAPVVTFARAPGLAPPELLWPAPHRYDLPGGLEAFGYADEVIYPVRTAIDVAAGSSMRLAVNIDYLVCEVDCVPHRYDLSLDQPLGDRAAADPRTAPLLDRWWRELPLEFGHRGTPEHAATTELAVPPPAIDLIAGPQPRLELRLRGVGAAPGGADLFFETNPVLELGRPRALAVPGGLLFEVPARRQDASAPLPSSLDIAWTATGLELAGSASPLAVTARQTVQIAASSRDNRASLPVTSSTPTLPEEPAGAPSPARTKAPTPPEHRLRGILATGDPRVVALAAAAAALLALEAWGMVRPPAPPGNRRQAAGFLALLLTLALLYALSLEISAERLAGIELALLAMGLLAWLRRRVERPGIARLALAAGLAACILVPPWLAGSDPLRAAATLAVPNFHPDAPATAPERPPA
jgi:DsbC/DsbD-like thiol-disulfide interchange protein